MSRKYFNTVLLLSTTLLTGLALSRPLIGHADASTQTSNAVATTTSSNSSSSTTTSDGTTYGVDNGDIAWVKYPSSLSIVTSFDPGTYDYYDADGSKIATKTSTFSGILRELRINLAQKEAYFMESAAKVYFKISDTSNFKALYSISTLYATKKLTINFVDDNNKSIDTSMSLNVPDDNDGVQTTNYAQTIETALLEATPTITDYTFDKAAMTTDTESNPTIMYHFSADSTTSSSSSSESSSSESNSSESSSSESSSVNSATSSTDSGNLSDSSSANGASDTATSSATKVSVSKTSVYATRKIGLYKTVNFTKNNRIRWYQKQPRTKRPKFTVIGYARTKAGTLRYKVKTTSGQTGYITANTDYVGNTYYQTTPKKITVINAKGINAYRKVNLTSKVRHYRKGTALKIKAVKQHGITTRLILTNGTYITANKTMVLKK
ncbi:DUF5776 domain-containing protein [Levilactobacillus brevis]|uniref:DUF5776 domain-containing protein n=1 Tax=Levilactobacillus brevis TaxID=1580 RepID=UPI0005B6C6F5|nr:DUF5776 domain-containing protein [Levilactobacillus brevis]KIP00032.1 Type IV pilus biogenesis protein PilO [Levilactobacillus brevis]